jgi:CHASE3 domain sensor protein
MEYYYIIGIVLIGLTLYFGYKIGQTAGVIKLLDTITEDFQEERGYFEDLERKIQGKEIYLNSCIDFYDNHKESMSDEEKTRHLRTIRQYSEEVNQLKQVLAEEKLNNQNEYEQEKLVIVAKRETLLKVIKTARYLILCQDSRHRISTALSLGGLAQKA